MAVGWCFCGVCFLLLLWGQNPSLFLPRVGLPFVRGRAVGGFSMRARLMVLGSRYPLSCRPSPLLNASPDAHPCASSHIPLVLRSCASSSALTWTLSTDPSSEPSTAARHPAAALAPRPGQAATPQLLKALAVVAATQSCCRLKEQGTLTIPCPAPSPPRGKI